ncbi:hypothetical protein Dimus_009316 [Dionaea muscipula]
MATYFHGGSEIQADNMQTLYLMNPNYSGYSVSDQSIHQHHHRHPHHQPPQQQPPGLTPNMLLLNSGIGAHNTLNPAANITHSQLSGQHLEGIPLTGPNPNDPSRPSLHHLYSLWNSVEASAAGSGVQPHIPTGVVVGSGSHHHHHDMMRFRRQVAHHHHQQQQGLSLSLSPQHDSVSTGQQGPVTVLSPTGGGGGGGGGEEMSMSVGCSPTSVSAASNAASGEQRVILGCKYLKAAQQLLDEVVSVGKALNADSEAAEGGNKEKGKTAAIVAGGEGSSGGGESCGKRSAELTTAQRQELQMKKAKLLNMLDEVEQRYRQYHNQMQIVVTSFEQAAGLGSAKSYTSLALKTISRKFRCLKDAIESQIKATSKSLGEDDGKQGEGGTMSSSSRLRFVDHQLQQQRALQHLGMVQHNAWRPQRGLPERAVSVLRAWLFEHFLHPYPKDSDKHLLAKQTGLTRSQVSNWFINARVRLWKPMVEEMYLEEMKAHEQNCSEEKSGKNEHENNNNNKLDATAGSSSKQDRMENEANAKAKVLQQQAAAAAAAAAGESHNPIPPMNHDFSSMTSATNGSTIHAGHQGFSLIGSSDMDFMISSTKKQRSDDMQNSPSSILSMEMEMKPTGAEAAGGKDLAPRYGADHNRHQLLAAAGGPNHGFGAYHLADIGRFDPELLGQTYHGNGVSLTLGLHHSENLSLSGTHQQNYLPNQNIQLGRLLDMGPAGDPDFCGITTAQPSHPNSGYEGIAIQNRKRFAAQLLPDFVT